MFQFKSIRARILFYFYSVVFATMLFGTVVSYTFVSDQIRKLTISKLEAVADARHRQIDQEFHGLRNSLEQMSRNKHVREEILVYDHGMQGSLDLSGVNPVSTRFHYAFNITAQALDFDDLLLIDVDGNVIYSLLEESDLGTNLKSGPYNDSSLADVYRAVLSQQPFAYSNWYHYEPAGDYAFFMAAPILEAGEIVGIIVAQLSMGELKTFTRSFRLLGETGEIVLAGIVDNQATVLAPLRYRSDAAFNMTFDSLTQSELPIMKAIRGEIGIGESVDYRGNPIIAVWRNLPLRNWGMVVKMDSAEVFASIDQLRIYYVISFVIASIAVFFITTVLSKTLSAPIKRLAEAADDMSHGRLKEDLAVEGLDELARMGASFNSMRRSLSKTEDELRALNAGLEQRVMLRTQQLENVNEELANALDTIKATQSGIVQTEKMAALGVLAAGVGHELNNPLMGILNYIEYAQSHSKDERINQILGKALVAVGRIDHIVSNIMTYAHTNEVKLQPLEVRKVIEDVTELTATDLRHAGISLEVHHGESLPMIFANASEIYQCVLNLVLNARDALLESDSKLMTIDSFREGKFVVINISDSGPGIPADIMEKIFDPFYTTKPTGKGTGLGLSVSRNLVEKQGGTLTVSNLDTGGASFQIRLKSVE